MVIWNLDPFCAIQEGAEEIQEPKEVVYKEIDFDSAVSYGGSGKNNSSEESRIEGFRSSLLERNGWYL